MKAIELNHSIDYEASVIGEFTSEGDLYGGREIIFGDHPKLKLLLKDSKKKLNIPTIKSYLKTYYADTNTSKNIEIFRSTIESAWGEVEQPLLQIFSKLFGYNVSDLPKATGYIGSLSIYPRDITAHTFLIGFKQPVYSALKTILHEYTHFVYFDKWKELFPKDLPEATYAPSKLWQLSEILAVVINSDERFLRLIPDAENQGFCFDGKSFYSTVMPGTNYSIIGYYKKLYLDYKKRNVSIDEFLRECRKGFLELKL